MNASPPLMVAASRSVLSFPTTARTFSENLRPKRDLGELLQLIDYLSTPMHIGIDSTDGRRYCGWAIEDGPVGVFSHTIYLSQALPPYWNPRNRYTSQELSAECSREAFTLELTVTPGKITPVALYPSFVQLQDLAHPTPRSQRHTTPTKISCEILSSSTQYANAQRSTEITNERREYKAPRYTHDQLGRLFDASTKSTIQQLTRIADQIVTDLLQQEDLALPSRDGNEYAPWFNASEADTVAQNIALQQLGSLISNAPPLSQNSIEQYMSRNKQSKPQRGGKRASKHE